MAANHVEHSRDWSKIKSLLELSTRASTDSQKFYSLDQQKEAEDLAKFLMHSSLTTEPLDRDCVSALLNGTKLWERNGKLVSISKGIEIEYLEECCLVMFEADCLLLTCNLENHLEQHVDDSLIPVIETLRTLQHIQRGQEGYKKPNLFVSEEIWNREFTRTSLLRSYVEKEDNSYIFNGRNHNLNLLVSTFLWQKLLSNSTSSKEAFEQWLRIMRFTCSAAFPVLKYATSDVEYSAYTAELQKHLLNLPVPKDLARSISNSNHFSDVVINYTQTLKLTISIGGSQAEGESNNADECVKQPRQNAVKKDSLPSFNSHSLSQVSKNEFSQIQEHLKSRTYRDGVGYFYGWLISDFLEESICIDNHSLFYPHKLIELIEFSLEHPLLKYLLFCDLFRFKILPKYFCLLLSRIDTCNFTIFWFSYLYDDIDNQISNRSILEELEIFISKKYAETNSNNVYCNEDFLDIVLVLTNKLGLYKDDFKDSHYYTLFDNFLKHQQSNKILSMIDIIKNVELSEHAYPNPAVFNLRNNKYFLLWWLYDFIDRNSLDTEQVHISEIVNLITNELEQDLKLNLEGKKSNLDASVLIKQYPWYKLVINDNVERLLSISKRHKNDWSSTLLWTNDSQYNAKRAISCYFQILMVVANHDSCQHLSKLHKRNISIVDNLGFDTNKRDGLFRTVGVNDYDLWPDFCIYINKIDDSDFEDFLDSNDETLTNSQLFQLMEACIHPARKELIKSAITKLAINNIDNSSLDVLEKTFVSAYSASEFDLALTVLNQASHELNEGRFKDQHHHLFAEKRQLIKCYQYKLKVTLLAINQDEYTPDFQAHINDIPIPFTYKEKEYYNECEHFRRYYLAYYLIEHDTNKSILILERLVEDTSNPEHILMLLHAYLANHHEASNITLIRNALSKVEQSAKAQWSVISSYPLPWISGILHAYSTIDDISSMRKTWELLSSAQKFLPQLLTPYCELLLKHKLVKEADIAFSAYIIFLGQYEALSDELEKINDTIMNALAKESSATQYIDRFAERNQRSPEQLANSFKLINGSDVETYVKITNNSSVEEYLVETVSSVSKELLSRSKNIYIPVKDEESPSGYSSKPANEDRINQWFCSLFNMREKSSPLHILDQSQIGSSSSGKSYGEVDGVIVDNNQSRRIALFEAFRLLKWDTTVINDHMDKLAGYDRECFDTIFVVVYAFDNDFVTLLDKYKNHIKQRQHIGFTKANGYALETVNGEDSDTFWMGKEERQRGNVTVSIYHVVISFYCEKNIEP
ncbi:hypothetical protein ACSA3Z_001185 [Vibrio cholerae]|uniref:hypothetical protein n=1 Tax=Vibrio cholerae TaxID=666 RepID=UPI0011F1A136|nr:hypothetical protein [Vibrio cholerae]EGR1702064.1 hypothetical protein [Vibrio cholerae]EGR2416957.1 hypothetical protein [Vibrio cholerae]ELF6906478.1 hypothetical protein [Vibrio cholerae]KAA1206677.1 hypothetical protein F0Q16_16785 [Vibrio cholerae]KAA1220692.1 hypothetical protein F0M23_15430 [Vibrio cholerae]